MNALVAPKSCQIEPHGLVFNRSLTVGECMDVGKWLANLDGTLSDVLKWAKGDYLSYFEHQHGEKYSQATALWPENKVETLKTYHWVSSHVPKKNRTSLSWAHHRLIARFDPEKQAKLLAEAVKHKWTTREFHEHIVAKNGEDAGLRFSHGIEKVVKAFNAWVDEQQPHTEMGLSRVAAEDIEEKLRPIADMWKDAKESLAKTIPLGEDLPHDERSRAENPRPNPGP